MAAYKTNVIYACAGCGKKLKDDEPVVRFCGKCIFDKQPQRLLKKKLDSPTKGNQINPIINCSQCNKQFAANRSSLAAGNRKCDQCSTFKRVPPRVIF